MRLAPGTQLGRYILLRELGAGGPSQVYAAYDPELDRTVALKLLRRDPLSSQESQARLQHEARAMARLTSPYVLPIYDVGTWQEQIFLAMEWVDGGTLTQWLHEQPRGWREVLAVFIDAGRGLAAAHAVGLAHRDFKTDNVLIGADGRVRVSGFGLARSTEPQASLSVDDTGADQHGFCVALDEALRDKRVPAWLRRAVLRGLGTSSEARFTSMEALLEALEADPRARRQRWGLAAGALGLALAAALVTHQVGVRRSQLCQGAERKLEGIWDARMRQMTEAAFLATGRPYAASTWHSVAAWLDHYAADWVGAHVEACKATRIQEVQSEEALDLRMACLERRRQELGALTRLLSQTDAGVMDRALSAAQGLAPLSGCADVQALREHPSLPEGEPRHSQAEALRQKLDEVKVLYETDQFARGLAVALKALDEARPLAFPPLEAEVLLRVGQLQERMEQPAAAEKTLLEAVLAAHSADRPELAAQGYLALVYLTQERPEEALRWIRFASASIEASGNPPRLQAQLLHYEALVLMAQQKLEESLDRFRQAVDILERALGQDSPVLATTLSNMGIVLFKLKRSAEAVPLLERAVSILERAHGADFPGIAATLHILALQQTALDDVAGAIASASRARGIVTRTLGPEHSWLLGILHTLGNALAAAGRYPEALESFQRGLALAEKLQGAVSRESAMYHSSISRVLLKQGQHAESLALAERVLQVSQQLPDHGERAYYLSEAGRLWRVRKQPARALEYFQRSLALLESQEGPEGSDLSIPLTGIGQCWMDLGQPEQALAPLQRALDLWNQPLPDELAETQFALSVALDAVGREPDRAHSLAEAASEGYRKAGARATAERATVQQWLARHAAPGL